MIIEHLCPAGEWRQLRGPAYGLQQSALIGELAVAPVAPAEGESVVQSVLRQARLVVSETPPRAGDELLTGERLAHLFAWLAGAIQREWRIPVSERFHIERVEVPEGRQQFLVALPSPVARAGEVARRWAQGFVNHAMAGPLTPDHLKRVREWAERAFKPHADPRLNRFLIMSAAMRLEIPVQPLVSSVLLLGTGRHSRWMHSTITDRTPSIAVTFAKLKQDTARLLRMAGLPGGEHAMVPSRAAAIEAAARLGYPVVVKPADRDQGAGVAADLRDEAAVGEAYDEAMKHSERILVEKWVPGRTHRLTVFQGKVLRVTQRIAGGVIGDGVRDVSALVKAQQTGEFQQRIARHRGGPLLTLDDEALGMLRQDGRDAGYVPAAGEEVRLRRRDNVSAGGTNVELDPADANAVHPDNIELAIEAARVLRLDFAGVDLITTDISRSWLEVGGLVCEVNAQPQVGAPRFYDSLLPQLMGPETRIPVTLVVCAAAGRPECRKKLVAEARFDAVSDAGGIFASGRRVTGRFSDGFAAARALLMRSDTASGACVMTPEEIFRFGLPVDRFDRVIWADASSFDPAERERLAAVAAMLRSPGGMDVASAHAA
ncbi:MAG TPA: hypothetical protein VHA82_01590 [Ramlibacter sp.]|uniref:ATP-binding protein n=1 Tax=Ramlibacter sp. TaxID=1917967 RepID=UPI002BA9C510|nr:hypothetical protein [Ramlibacter sp.]HVZ42474.1 hypothetical protein [Ramlibacter sp.]